MSRRFGEALLSECSGMVRGAGRGRGAISCDLQSLSPDSCPTQHRENSASWRVPPLPAASQPLWRDWQLVHLAVAGVEPVAVAVESRRLGESVHRAGVASIWRVDVMVGQDKQTRHATGGWVLELDWR